MHSVRKRYLARNFYIALKNRIQNLLLKRAIKTLGNSANADFAITFKWRKFAKKSLFCNFAAFSMYQHRENKREIHILVRFLGADLNFIVLNLK